MIHQIAHEINNDFFGNWFCVFTGIYKYFFCSRNLYQIHVMFIVDKSLFSHSDYIPLFSIHHDPSI